MTEPRPALAMQQETFDNGLQLAFFDESNRYFGDYHRIRVLVEIRLPLTPKLFRRDDDQQAACERAIEILGEVIVETRALERMGVPSEKVEAVRSNLINDFLANAGKYLHRPDYPERLLYGRLAKTTRRPTGAYYR